jgi:beta-fructofuranosidase
MKKRILTIAALLTAVSASFAAAEKEVQPTDPSVQPTAITFHYRPPDTHFGDPVPFYHEGIHHVFYLHPKGGLNWNHLTSRDLVHWEDLGPAIDVDEDDALIATGSIVEHDGLFHAFYTTSDRKDTGPGRPSVRVATSSDLIEWTKEPGPPLILLKRDVPVVGTYDAFSTWRDPHVFWNPKAEEWWLAIAAHEKLDPKYPYAGAVALATSKDLRKWTVQPEPLLASREIVASECPDVFPFGDGWAMLYYTDTTRVRLADDPAGPWRRPVNDAPWGLHFQAGKTEFDGKRRIVHAYLQRTDSDFGKHVYGGNMTLPRELYPADDGSVAVRLVPEIIAACAEDATGGKGGTVFAPLKPDRVATTKDRVTLPAETGTAAIASWKETPADFFLTADVKLSPGATLNFLLRGNGSESHPGRENPNPLDDSYVVSLDAHAGQVILYRQNDWNRVPTMRTQPLRLPTDRSLKLYLMLHGDVLEVFVDDRISLCARVQNSTGALALLARDGEVSLDNLRITRLP